MACAVQVSETKVKCGEMPPVTVVINSGAPELLFTVMDLLSGVVAVVRSDPKSQVFGSKVRVRTGSSLLPDPGPMNLSMDELPFEHAAVKINKHE